MRSSPYERGDERGRAFLPSVAFASNAAGGGLNGPGFVNVYMRGVASGNDGNHSGSQPSVGIWNWRFWWL